MLEVLDRISRPRSEIPLLGVHGDVGSDEDAVLAISGSRGAIPVHADTPGLVDLPVIARCGPRVPLFATLRLVAAWPADLAREGRARRQQARKPCVQRQVLEELGHGRRAEYEDPARHLGYRPQGYAGVVIRHV